MVLLAFGASQPQLSDFVDTSLLASEFEALRLDNVRDFNLNPSVLK